MSANPAKKKLNPVLKLVLEMGPLVLFFFALRHPAIVDPSPIGRTRGRLALLALIIFVLSFTLAPIRPAGL